MSEQLPDVLGKSMQFKNDTGQDMEATILQSFGLHGGKSFIFYALIDETNEKIIVKYPKPDESIKEESNVLDLLKHTDAKRNIPECWNAMVDGTDVLLMEWMPKSRQWQTLRMENHIKPSEVVDGLRQALFLLDTAHQNGIINTDIKIENCYWLEESRFVLIDWNKYQKFSKNPIGNQKDQFENLKRQNYLVFFNFAYLMLTGEDPINPLPLINSPEPRSWKECPYLIRKLMQDLREKKDLSFSEAETSLSTLSMLLKYKEENNFGAIIAEGEKVLQGGMVTATSIDDLENILSILPKDLPAEYKDRIVLIQQQIRDKFAEFTQLLKSTEKEVLQMISERRSEAAVKTAESAIRKIQLVNTKKWDLAKILTLSKLITKIVDESVYISPDDAEVITATFMDHKKIGEIHDPYLREKLEGLYKLFSEADEWIVQLGKGSVSDYFTLIKQTKDFQSWLSGISDKGRFHPLTIEIFLSMIPDWDVQALENAIQIKDQVKRQNEMIGKFMQSIKDTLLSSSSYPLEAMEGILVTTPEELSTESIYEAVYTVHNYVKKQDWINALQVVKEKSSLLGEELTLSFDKKLSAAVEKWMEDIEGRPKYRTELLKMQQLQGALKKDEFNKISKGNLQKYIETFESADKNDHESLERCVDLAIEPWMMSAEDDFLSVSSFLRLLDLREYKTTLDEIQNRFANVLELSPKRLQEMKQQTEDQKRMVDDLQNSIKEMNGQIEKTENNLNSISKEGKKKIRILLKTIDQEFPRSIQENPDWWKLLLEGDLNTLELKIRGLEEQEVDVDRIALQKWTGRVQQVKDLSDFQLLIKNLKKTPDYLIEKEAMLRIVFPDYLWEAAENYSQKRSS